MKELGLLEVQKIELDLLKVFAEFCKENNIRYYLSHGALLGAIRYKKFIPWDDDIDLLIPREDYDRMLSIFKDSDRYRLFAFEKDPNYRYPFAKLCDMTTRKVETGYDNGVELGIDIDLFPLDAWNNDLPKAKREAKSLLRNIFCLTLSKKQKPDPLVSPKRYVKAMIMFLSKLLGSKFFIRRIHNISCNTKQKGSQYVGCKAWCVYGERGIIPAEAFADSVEVDFEGMKFPAPADWDKYLTCLFGDYLPEPPKEKQKTHHSFVAYKL